MKKFFVKAALCLSIGTLGLTTASCGSEDLSGIVNELITQLITNLVGQKGQVYNYSVKGTAQRLDKSGNSYVNNTSAKAFTATLPVTVNNSTAMFVLPAMEIDGIKMTDITYNNLTLTAATNGEYTSMDVSNNLEVSGTATINGTEYPARDLYIKEACLTSAGIYITTMQIYFGENGEYVLSLANVQGDVISASN